MTPDEGAQLTLAISPEPSPQAGAPEPTPEQRAAIASRDRDVFCEAGAGTGKTRVLVERYCDAIADDGLGLESILAFTFTERAAAELRTRIRRELTQRAANARESGDEDRTARLGRAARETEGAWVMTIHGFCRRMLAGHPAAAGIDPRFRVLDEGEASRLRRRARDAAVDEVLRRGDRDRTELIAAYRPERFGDLAVAAHERLRSQGMAEPSLPAAPPPSRSIKDPDGDHRELSPVESELALGTRAALEAVLEAFHRAYGELKAARSGLDFADLELRALELLRASPAIASVWRGRFSHVLVDEFQDTNAVQLELVEALRGPETRVFRVGDELQSIYRFRNADLAVFRAERGRAREDTGTLVQPLTGNFRSRPGVVAAVNAVGGALIGDGYQPLVALRDGGAGGPAAELLLTLDEGKSNGWAEHERELSPPPSERQAKVVAEARALALRLREIVDSGEARPGEIVVLLRAFTHVDAYEEALARAGLDPYVAGGRGYWSQQQVEDMLRLLETVANPLDDEMLLGALAGPAAGVSPDALWLLRRATRADRDRRERPPSERDSGATPEAAERRSAPGHLWPVVAWRFGGSDRRPDGIDERWLDAIPDADGAALELFCERLAELRSAAPVLALESLVERTMTAFDYDLALLARERGRGRMANVRKLVRLAREFEAHDGRDLRAFLEVAAELTERDEREGLAATQAEDHDGVRIMTVHAAKGLEFPVVAVPDLSRSLSEGERPGDVILGRRGSDGDREPGPRFGLRLVPAAEASFAAWELHELYDENVSEAAEEGTRLVHVAATRAEDRLILGGVFRLGDCEARDPQPRDNPLRRLLPALVALGWDPEAGDAEIELPGATGSAAGEPPAGLAITVSAPSAERARDLSRRIEPPAAETAAAGDARRPPLARPPRIVPTGHLSYSALADYERCAYRFYVERLLGLEAPPAPLHPEAADLAAEGAAGEPSARDRRLALGNAVHAALEWSARRRWQRPDRELLETLLSDQGLGDDGATVERALALTGGWLDSPLCGELAGSELRAEVPFAIELAGTVVRGQIDLLALGPEPVVVDYKTDALGDAGPADLGERYRAQRELYALAAGAANRDRKPPAAVRAVHLFLEAPGDPVEHRFDGDGLRQARRRLEELIGEIRRGGFEPTGDPSWQVCNGCPAAARLCPHPKWRPPRRVAARDEGSAAAPAAG